MPNIAKIYDLDFKNFQQNNDAENKITALYLRLSGEDEVAKFGILYQQE
jgi:hypothetical protein